MELALVIDWSRAALQKSLELGGLPLLAALAVGLVVGAGQTLTQLHEPVVAFVPRLAVVLVVVLVLLSWLVGRWILFTDELIRSIPGMLG
jgi:flagellar biosynthetic protein FliQ